MENRCQRCFTKKAIFNCPSCTKYHNFCQNCDEYIHSFKKSKSHKRYFLNSSSLSNLYPTNKASFNNFHTDILDNNNQLNTSNFSNKRPLNTFPLERASSPQKSIKQENTTPSFYKFQNYYNSTNSNTKTNATNKINKSNKKSNSNKKIKSINNYYNSNNPISIKNQIEYIQQNISEQINQVLSNIDINNQKMNYKQQLDEIEKKYQEQISQIMQIKNDEINILESEINEANKTNETLMNEISRANEDNNVKVIELTNIINMLTDELNQKEEQLMILKGNSQKNEINHYNNIDEEKDMISRDYENKINNILNTVELNQQKLLNAIKEKEVIIHNLINCNQNKNDEFNEFVSKINEDNQNLKDITQQSIGLAKYSLVNPLCSNDDNNK